MLTVWTSPSVTGCAMWTVHEMLWRWIWRLSNIGRTYIISLYGKLKGDSYILASLLCLMSVFQVLTDECFISREIIPVTHPYMYLSFSYVLTMPHWNDLSRRVSIYCHPCYQSKGVWMGGNHGHSSGDVLKERERESLMTLDSKSEFLKTKGFLFQKFWAACVVWGWVWPGVGDREPLKQYCQHASSPR